MPGRALLLLIALVSLAAPLSAQEPPKRNPPESRRTFVLPHVLERYSGAQFGGGGMGTFATTIIATYAGGLAGLPAAGRATVELYLYNEAGQLLRKNESADVCGPCGYPLGASSRKATFPINELLGSGGGGGGAAGRLGFGIIVIKGDVDNVGLQGFVTNTHEGSAVSVFGFEPQELSAPAP